MSCSNLMVGWTDLTCGHRPLVCGLHVYWAPRVLVLGLAAACRELGEHPCLDAPSPGGAPNCVWLFKFKGKVIKRDGSKNPAPWPPRARVRRSWPPRVARTRKVSVTAQGSLGQHGSGPGPGASMGVSLLSLPVGPRNASALVSRVPPVLAPAAAKDLVSHLLVVDPKKRYTAHQVLQHPWIEAAGKTSPGTLPSSEGHSQSQHEPSAEQTS